MYSHKASTSKVGYTPIGKIYAHYMRPHKIFSQSVGNALFLSPEFAGQTLATRMMLQSAMSEDTPGPRGQGADAHSILQVPVLSTWNIYSP